MAGESAFQVQVEAIIAHAGTVDDVTAQVAQARSAASAVRLGRDAYGLLCQLIPTLLDPIQEQAVAAMQEAAEALQRTADDLRATASDYTGSDGRTADVFRGGQC